MQNYLKGQISEGDLLMEESAQVWTFDPSRKFIFRVRTMVGIALRAEKMELDHKVPLKYDFLRITGSLEYGGKCIPRQCEVLLMKITTRSLKRCGKNIPSFRGRDP